MGHNPAVGRYLELGTYVQGPPGCQAEAFPGLVTVEWLVVTRQLDPSAYIYINLGNGTTNKETRPPSPPPPPPKGGG